MASTAKETQAMQEQEAQRAAQAYLDISHELPKNLSEMKSFAWGQFTWRDVIASAAILLIMVILTMPFYDAIGQIPCLLISFGLSLPGIYVVNRHHFTGDLPIEKRLKIAMDNWGKPDLLVWDKTKMEGSYVGTSTHDFVPAVTFGNDGVAILPGNKGGFSVLRITVDDSDNIKPTERAQIQKGFLYLLNRLNTEKNNIPIQIFLKSSRQDLSSFVQNAENDLFRIEDSDKNGSQLIKRERADNYAQYLQYIAQSDRFYYDYYIVVTYREDAEDAGNDTINSASVRREKMKDNANPLKKKERIMDNVDVELGEDMAKARKEAATEAEFGEVNTRTMMGSRIETVTQSIKASGTTNSSISAEMLTREEVAKLFFQCYNPDDGRVLDQVIHQSVDQKIGLYSTDVRRDFPGLFPRPEKEEEDRFETLQRRGTIIGGRGGR